jgi:hypothetical protein
MVADKKRKAIRRKARTDDQVEADRAKDRKQEAVK